MSELIYTCSCEAYQKRIAELEAAQAQTVPDSREAFEAQIVKCAGHTMAIEKGGDGSYLVKRVADNWEGWQLCWQTCKPSLQVAIPSHNHTERILEMVERIKQLVIADASLSNICDLCDELKAALAWQASQPQAQAVPDGWGLVPVKVTPAIEAVYANNSGVYQTAQELHDAMLTAAPTPAINSTSNNSTNSIDTPAANAAQDVRNQALEEAACLVENKYVPCGPFKPVRSRIGKRVPETAGLMAKAIRALKTPAKREG